MAMERRLPRHCFCSNQFNMTAKFTMKVFGTLWLWLATFAFGYLPPASAETRELALTRLSFLASQTAEALKALEVKQDNKSSAPSQEGQSGSQVSSPAPDATLQAQIQDLKDKRDLYDRLLFLTDIKYKEPLSYRTFLIESLSAMGQREALTPKDGVVWNFLKKAGKLLELSRDRDDDPLTLFVNYVSAQPLALAPAVDTFLSDRNYSNARSGSTARPYSKENLGEFLETTTNAMLRLSELNN